MIKKLRLKQIVLMAVLASMALGLVAAPDAFANTGNDLSDVVFEEDEYTYTEKSRADDEAPLIDEPEMILDDFYLDDDGTPLEYKEYTDEEIEAYMNHENEPKLDLDGDSMYTMIDPTSEPERVEHTEATLESELKAIEDLPEGLRKDLEKDIRAKYSSMKSRTRARVGTRAAVMVDRNTIAYDVDSMILSGDTLTVGGWAFSKDLHNYRGSSTHEISVFLRNASTGKEIKRVATLKDDDFTQLMSYNGYRPCRDDEYKIVECNLYYQNVGFEAKFNMKELDPNAKYNMFLEIKSFHKKAPGGLNHQRIPVYHQDQRPIKGLLSDGRRLELKSDFEHSRMYTYSPYLLARMGPKKTDKTREVAVSCGPNKNVAYFEQGKENGTFSPIGVSFDDNGVRWFQFGWQYSGCKPGVVPPGLTGNTATVTWKRNRLKEGKNANLWTSISFLHFIGDPLEITTITPATSRELHKASDGKVLFDQTSKSWFGERWSYARKTFKDYDYVGTSGHAQTGVFDNGVNKHAVVNYNYKPSRGDIKIQKNDENGKGIAGVKFEMSYTKNFKQSWTYTTGSNGSVTAPNWEAQTIYYREVSVPSPIIINRTIKSALIKSNQTVNVGITNPIAKGRIDITKVDEYGKVLPNVKFRIRNSANAIVKDVVTNSSGKVSLGGLALGKYTIEELGVPKHFIKPAIVTVNINYQNADTPTVVSSVRIVNKFQPVADIGVNRLRVNTKTAAQGLDVESWYDKNLLYDFSINKFKDTPVTLELTDYNSGKVIDTKTYTIEKMPTYQVFKVPASQLAKGAKKDFRVNVKSSDESKVTVKTRKNLTIDGYAAEEKNTVVNAVPGATVVDKKVVRTDRAYGKNIQYYYETLTMKIPRIEKLRTGSSFKYGIEAEYKNDLGTNSNITMNTTAEGKILDGEGPEYVVNNSLYGGKGGKSFALTPVGKRFTPPIMYAKKDIDSDIITANKYNSLSAAAKKSYRKVDGDMVSAIWQADLGKYKLDTKTNQIGTHRLSYDINSVIDTFAFLYGHYDGDNTSSTIDSDRILITPISSFSSGGDVPDMWKDQMPDNWGVQNGRSGSRALTPLEKKFFGY